MLAEKGGGVDVLIPRDMTRGYTTCRLAAFSLPGQCPFPFELSDNALVDELFRLGGKDKPASFIEAGKDKDDFLQRRSGLDNGRMKNGKEQKNNANPLKQNTAGAQETYPPKQTG
jgi:hypothetical protein